MKLSVVTTLYNSSGHLNEFYDRMAKAVKSITPEYEFVLVNDGSPDDSLEKAVALHRRDPRVMVVDLARNFGHHKAAMAGLGRADGDYILMIDCDLEEDPELLATYWAEMRREPDNDVVYGIWKNEKGNCLDRLGRWLFFTTFNWLSDVKIPRNAGFSRLCTKRYCQALLQHAESEVFLAGLWFSVGFRQKSVPIIKRDLCPTNYTLRRKVEMFVNAMASFSSMPLAYIFGLGIVVSGFSGLLVFLMILGRIFFGLGGSSIGWASTIVSIWLVGGIIIFCLGVLGIYVSKMFIEVKKRPATIVRAIYGDEARLVAPKA